MTFHLEACRLQLSARAAIHFRPRQAGNLLRGALGSILREAAAQDYPRLFDPVSAGGGPSGFSNRPRPFVIRAANLNGRMVQPGERFCFDIHLFDTSDAAREPIMQAFAQWAELISVQRRPVALDISPSRQPVSRIRIDFQTPTDLKGAAENDRAEFALLLARARDRVSTLRSLYGPGPLEIDFRGLGERAQAVKMVRSHLQPVAVERRSSRTGQRHGIGGLVGFAEYQGELAEFLPYLEAAAWTGIGRHCTWGNGQIRSEILAF